MASTKKVNTSILLLFGDIFDRFFLLLSIPLYLLKADTVDFSKTILF